MNTTIGNFNLSQLISQILTDEAKKNGKKLIDIVNECGISQPTWSRIQAGSSLLSIDEINQICEYANINILQVIEQALSMAKLIQQKELASLTFQQTQAVINRTTLKYLIALSNKDN